MVVDIGNDDDWRMLVGLLPPDLDVMAFLTGAITRRRKIRGGEALVRLALIYAGDDASLRRTSALAHEIGIASMSDQAILKRLCRSVELLRSVCSYLLAKQESTPMVGNLRAVLVDSTTVCRHRSSGTDFRVHTNYDVARGQISGFELTRSDGGERLNRVSCSEGDLLVGDQGYPSRIRIHEVRSTGAHVAVRFFHSALPLEDNQGERINVLDRCKDLKIGDTLDISVATVATKQAPSVQGRMIVLRKSPEEADRQIERSRKSSGKEPSPETKLAARYIMIFTTVPYDEASTKSVLDVYRIRWQIEMLFKRAKGVISLGETEARDLRLCEAKILGKLLLMLLMQAFDTVFFPWGYPLPRFESVAPSE